MFSVFLKAKYDIEAKLNNLQKTYLDLLNAPIREIQFTSHNNNEKAQQIIDEKLETLSEIKKNYKEALTRFEQLSKLLIETKEVTEDTESYLDFCFEVFGIEIPEDLQRKPPQSPIQDIPNQHPAAHQSYQTTDDEEDKENSRIYPEEEEENSEESFDKENLQSPNSDEFFSPNIQIRKSFKIGNTECFTPAVKSTSKSKQSKVKSAF